MKDNDVLQVAIQHLTLQSGLKVQKLPASTAAGRKKSSTVHGISIDIEGGTTYELQTEIKNEIRGEYVGVFLSRNSIRTRGRILVSQYISKPNRALLKQNGVNYLDASGNCYIKYRSLLLYINDNPVTAQRLPERGKLWKTAGLKLVFAILAKPGLLNQSYRSIGQHSTIALGMVGPLLKEMESEGFITKTENGFVLENREILLSRWIGNFQSHLRPKISYGRFRFEESPKGGVQPAKDMRKARWSGETAAYILTGFLQPEHFTIYSSLPVQELVKQFHIMPDPQGELEILSPFWNEEQIVSSQEQCVPELLVYAELASSLHSRTREAARHVKNMFHL